MSKKITTICAIVVLILGLTITNVFATNVSNDKGSSKYGQLLSNNLEQLVKKQMNAYNWKLDNLSYIEVSNKVSNNNVEVMWLVEVKHRLNYDKAESVPILKGKLRYFNESKNNLTDVEKSVAQTDIESWKANLEDYIKNEQYMGEYVKITAQTNDQNEIIPGTIKEFIENGKDYTPVDEFIKVPDKDTQENSGYESLQSQIMDLKKLNKGSNSSSPVQPMSLVDIYNKEAAKDYANEYVKATSLYCETGPSGGVYQNPNNYNLVDYPTYFECNDCANFVSQCLVEGGIPTTTTWEYHTDTWVNANMLVNYMKNNGYGYQISRTAVPIGGIVQATAEEHVYLVTYNDGTTLKANSHTKDRYQISLGSGYAANYYAIHYYIEF